MKRTCGYRKWGLQMAEASINCGEMRRAWGWIPVTELPYECLTWTCRSICVPAEGSSQPLRLRWEECLHRWAPPVSSDERGGHGIRPWLSRPKEFKRLRLRAHWSRSWTGSFRWGRRSHSPPGRPCRTFLSHFRVKWQDRNTVLHLTYMKLWEFSLVKCSSRGSHVQERTAEVTIGEYLSRTEIWASKTDRTVSL